MKNIVLVIIALLGIIYGCNDSVLWQTEENNKLAQKVLKGAKENEKLVQEINYRLKQLLSLQNDSVRLADFFQKEIAGKHNFRVINFSGDSIKKIFELHLEVFDTIALITGLEKEMGPVIYHSFDYEFIYHNNKWKPVLKHYQLKVSSTGFLEDGKSKYRFGTYYLDISDDGGCWICDYVDPSIFVWFVGRGEIKLGWSDYRTPELALEKTAPTSAYLIHQKVVKKIPKILPDY